MARRYIARGRPIERFWHFVEKSENCWLWTGRVQQTGYPYGVMQIGRPAKSTLAHRFSWALHNGEIPSGVCVCHRCDNPRCVNPAHLFLGTMADNCHDRDRKGRAATEERHPRAKITKEHARSIYQRASLGERHRLLAVEFGISRAAIYAIARGQTWRKATGALRGV